MQRKSRLTDNGALWQRLPIVAVGVVASIHRDSPGATVSTLALGTSHDRRKSMGKMGAVALVALMMFGCGAIDRSCAKVTGSASKTCVDGVQYLQFTSGATVQVDVDGKPVRCGQ